MNLNIGNIGVWGRGCPVDTSAEGRSADRAGRRDPPLPDYICRISKYRFFNAASAATLIINL